MNHTRLFTLTTILLGLSRVTVGDWGHDWDKCVHHCKVHWHHAKIDFLRNEIWPHPFREMDATGQRMPFAVMANNGWRLHHTLSHEVFREGDAVLTAVGRNRVQWIATQSPQHRRYIYVLNGRTQEETQQRVASVHDALSHFIQPGVAPQVLVTSKVPTMASGEYNTTISRLRRENMIVPLLPEINNGGGGGGGGQ